MGYPKSTVVEEKLAQKRRARKETKEIIKKLHYACNNSNKKVEFVDIFVPLLGINICLLISQNPEILENTFFQSIKLVDRHFQFHI